MSLHLAVPNNQSPLHFGVSDNKISLHFKVPNNQISLHLEVPNNCALNRFSQPGLGSLEQLLGISKCSEILILKYFNVIFF